MSWCIVVLRVLGATVGQNHLEVKFNKKMWKILELKQHGNQRLTYKMLADLDFK